MTRVTIGSGGRITIPRSIRREAHLSDGMPVELRVTPEGVLLAPADRDPDQWWFWTPEWQAGEREVDAAIARGELLGPVTAEEFIAELQRLDAEQSERDGESPVED